MKPKNKYYVINHVFCMERVIEKYGLRMSSRLGLIIVQERGRLSVKYCGCVNHLVRLVKSYEFVAN